MLKEIINIIDERLKNENENEKMVTKVMNETITQIERFLSSITPRIIPCNSGSYKTVSFRYNEIRSDYMKLLIVLLDDYFGNGERYERIHKILEEKGYKNCNWGVDSGEFYFEFRIYDNENLNDYCVEKPY